MIQTVFENFEILTKIIQPQSSFNLSEYFSVSSRFWTQIRSDGPIFDPYQDELNSFRKLRILQYLEIKLESHLCTWDMPLALSAYDNL